jgi:predicted N-acetyltransferase YhbS
MKWKKSIRPVEFHEAGKLEEFLIAHAGDRFAQMAHDYVTCMFSNDYRHPTFLIATEGDDIIGCAAYSHEFFTLLPAWGISWVNVRADRRNRRLGQALIDACVDGIAAQSKEATILLATLPGKSALYERSGFIKCGTDHAGGWLMVRTLKADNLV